LGAVIPAGEKVRRSFSFWPGEKSLLNRTYRRLVDWWLARRYRLTDYFFALSQQLHRDRLTRVGRLARTANVELMTHPAQPEEYAVLRSEDYLEAMKDVPVGSYAAL